MTKGKPSRARQNIDALVDRLNRSDIHNILETNVICYFTTMSKNLRDEAHAGGAIQGEEIFRYLLNEISPSVLIFHGVGAVKRIGVILNIPQLNVPGNVGDHCAVQTERHLVIPIPSLAPPAYHRRKWSSWRDECWMESRVASVKSCWAVNEINEPWVDLWCGAVGATLRYRRLAPTRPVAICALRDGRCGLGRRDARLRR